MKFARILFELQAQGRSYFFLVISSILTKYLKTPTNSHHVCLDQRTKFPTGIDPTQSSASQRIACTTLNRERTRGLFEAVEEVQRQRAVSDDVWKTSCGRWDVPIIRLEQLGIFLTEDDFLETEQGVIALPPGAEACPYWDKEQGVVYKLFSTNMENGLPTMGGKLEFPPGKMDEEFGLPKLELKKGTIVDMANKIMVLNDLGALPTEVVGVDENSTYLIAKQPFADSKNYCGKDSDDYSGDCATALEAMKAVHCTWPGLDISAAAVMDEEGKPWLVGDYHRRNIMIYEGEPTIIDAMVGEVPPKILRQLPLLGQAVEDAGRLRSGKPVMERRPFDAVDDDDL